MNSRLHTDRLAGVVLLATMLSSACAATPASTPTPEPTATSAPSHPALILAVDKPYRTTPFYGNVVYTLPEEDQVLLAFELTYSDGLLVDIYYPPAYNFEAKLPIVVLSHGFPGSEYADKDMPSHIDWAKLIAASGMIAVSAQPGDDPIKNSYRVFEFLTANADYLGVDLSRIGFWSVSGQDPPVFAALQDKSHPNREGFKAAAFLYSDTAPADPSLWPQSLALFVVWAGADENAGPQDVVNVEAMVSKARANNIPTEYIVLEGAPHAFDVYLNTPAVKDTIQKVLDFYKNRLLM